MTVHYTRAQVSNSHTAPTIGLSGKYSDSNTLTKIFAGHCNRAFSHSTYQMLLSVSTHTQPCERTYTPRLDKQTMEIFCDQSHIYTESVWNQQVANICIQMHRYCDVASVHKQQMFVSCNSCGNAAERRAYWRSHFSVHVARRIHEQ